ncbi:MAG: Hpt domain-containing protein [bacterium]|nr:Hpt domain-containing protein [bacterium]
MGFDWTMLSEVERVSGEKAVAEIVELFLEYGPQRLSSAREGVAAGDHDMLGQAVHTLKSSAGMIGATRLHDVAARMERLIKTDRAEEGAKFLPLLESEYARVESFLRERYTR